MEEPKLTDLNLLYESFLVSMKGSAWKAEPQAFEIDFLSQIVQLKHELEDHTYRTSKTTEFTLNERGKIRHIHGAKIRDRVVRHALCDGILSPALRPYLIYNNGASQKGKGIRFAREQFEKDLHNFYLKHGDNAGFIGFMDLSKFYDNVQHARIKAMVNPKIGEEPRWLLNEVLRSFEIDVSYMTDDEYRRCLGIKFDSVKYYETVTPEMKTGEKFMAKSVEIGDQVSQDVGVFFPTPIDNYVKIVRGQKWYGRYMDDMYVICREKAEVENVLAGAAEVARCMGLFVNERKTHIEPLGGQFRYLQTKYTLTATGRVIKRINPKSVTRERRKIKRYRSLLDKGKISYEDIEQACRCWMGNYAQLMSKKQIKHVKTLYKALFGKELSWRRQSNSKTGRN